MRSAHQLIAYASVEKSRCAKNVPSAADLVPRTSDTDRSGGNGLPHPHRRLATCPPGHHAARRERKTDESYSCGPPDIATDEFPARWPVVHDTVRQLWSDRHCPRPGDEAELDR